MSLQYKLYLLTCDRLNSKKPKNNAQKGNEEGVNGVNRLATKGEKYYWLPTKRGKNYRLATKILTEIYQQPTKVENFNRQPTK